MNSSSKVNSLKTVFHRPAIMLGLILVLAAGTLQVQARGSGRSHHRNPCEQIAYKTYVADLLEAWSEYTLDKAKAENIPDYSDRREAYMEAYEEYRETKSEARDQLIARLELCDRLEEGRYYPEIEPDNFCTPEEIAASPNPYFMLVPGRVMVYGGENDEGEEEIVEVTVTSNTKEILDIMCVEVRDIVTVDGIVVEDTRDWYAQDKDGNVWYFGEIAVNYEDGEISDLDGSWVAGENGALPGIQMFAVPVLNTAYRQEFLLGEAEDVAEITSLAETVESNGIVYEDCLETLEYTPLSPDAFEYKYYKAGVGMVLEVNPDTGETLELLAINP